VLKLATENNIALRQNYNRKAPRLAAQLGRYAHAKQYQRMKKSLERSDRRCTACGSLWRGSQHPVVVEEAQPSFCPNLAANSRRPRKNTISSGSLK